MTISPKPHLRNVQPCAHGSLSHRERADIGLPEERILDFSASCNPLGTSSRTVEAIRSVDLSRYPDDEALELRSALAGALGVDLDWIALGNGSVELIYQIAAAYLDVGDTALVVGPTFGEYARACAVAGATVMEVRAGEAGDFGPDVAAIETAIREVRPKIGFLCNPNNPTGQFIPDSAIVGLLDACAETLLVVDEAYLAFCDHAVELRPYLSSGNLLLLRSMTKDHGLAGLRLGYALARPDLLDPLGRLRPPWGVNALAQAAGLAALAETAHVDEALRVVLDARAYLTRELTDLGLTVVPSVANFLLVKVGDGAAFRAAMLSRGICVRDCASFDLPAYVRIGMRAMEECQRLVAAAREVAAGA